MSRPDWAQITIGFTDPRLAERITLSRVAPLLVTAEDTRLISAWFVVRKGHHWRLRYLPARSGDARAWLLEQLSLLRDTGHLTTVAQAIYEPEAHAFGGHRAMTIAHRLWHHDSRHLFTAPPPTQPTPGHARELSIMLCATMMRAAGLDWYEQGDVWARAAVHKRDERNPAVPRNAGALHDAMHRLITVDPASLTRAGAPLAAARTWIGAYQRAGAALGRIHHAGNLHRGLRDVLAHHVIFAWNRRGMPDYEQAVLAATAQVVIFGPDPTRAVPARTTGSR